LFIDITYIAFIAKMSDNARCAVAAKDGGNAPSERLLTGRMCVCMLAKFQRSNENHGVRQLYGIGKPVQA
jgi:hypothetical protein